MSPATVRQIDISVDEPFADEVSESWLHSVMEHALVQALAPDEGGQVSLLITDDETVKELNRDYRGLDETTDVLSFSANHAGPWEGEDFPVPDPASSDDSPFDFVLPPDELSPIGEVIISYPQTQRQAWERKEPVERELALLIIHGVLHLVGYDHQEPDDTVAMQAREQAALAEVFQVETGDK